MAEEYGLGSLRGVQDFTDDTSLGDYFSGEDTATPAQPSFIPEGYRPIELPNGTTAYVYKDYTDEQAIAELYKRNREAFAPQHTHPRHKPIPEGHAAQQEPPDEEFEKAKDQDKIVRELKEQDAKQQIIRNALYAEQQMPTAFNGQEAPLTPAPPADPQQLLRQKIAARVLNAQPTTPLAFEGALTPEQIAAGYIQPDPSKQGFLPGLAGGAAGLVGGVGGFAAENLQPFYPEAAESVRQAVAPMRAAEKAWHRPQSELERIQAHNQPGVMPGVQAELTHAGDVLGGFFGKWGVPMLASKAGPYGATAGVGLTYALLFDEFAQKAKEAKVPLSLPELHAGAALSTALFQLAPNFITKGIPFNAIAPSTKMIVDLYRTQGPEAAYKAVGNLAQNMVKSFAAGTVGATGAMVGTEAVQRQMLGQPQLTLEEATEMAKDAGIISAAMAYPHGRAATAEGRQAFAREAARDVRQRIAAREVDETMRREGVRVSPEAINEQNIAREWPEMRTGAERDQAVGAETISAETPPPAPPPTEEPAPPPAEEPAPKAYYEDLGLSPRSNVFKALQQLDVNDPAAHPAIIETLDMAIANPRLKVKDVDAMQQLRDQLQPPEVLSAEQITEAGAPDGSGGPQPILREEGGDQAISGKGVEQSGQGIEAPEVKAPEEVTAQSIIDELEPEDQRTTFSKLFQRDITGTRSEIASYRRSELQEELERAEWELGMTQNRVDMYKRPPKVWRDRLIEDQARVDALRKNVQAYTDALPELKKRDQADDYKEMDRTLLRDAHDDLDDAVAEGMLTRTQANEIKKMAWERGDQLAASQFIEGALNAAEDGYLTKYMRSGTGQEVVPPKAKVLKGISGEVKAPGKVAEPEAVLPQTPIEAWNALKGESDPEHSALTPEAKSMWAEAFGENGADRSTFDSLASLVVKKPAVRKEAEEIDTGEEDERYFSKKADEEEKPWWYSPVEKVLQSTKIKSQTGKQWKGWLAGQEGVKKDELEHSGINQFLDLIGDMPIEKGELLHHMKQFGVRIEERQLADERLPEHPEERHEILMQDPKYAQTHGLLEEVRTALKQGREELEQLNKEYANVLNKPNVDPEYFDTLRSKIDDTESVLREGFETEHVLVSKLNSIEDDIALSLRGEARHKRYTFSGGTDYRELLLKLPQKEGEDAKFVEPLHFDDPNVIAFARGKTRASHDPTEKGKTFFVEELQSDWGQQGQKQGFVAEGERAPRPISIIDQQLRAMREARSASYDEWHTAYEAENKQHEALDSEIRGQIYEGMPESERAKLSEQRAAERKRHATKWQELADAHTEKTEAIDAQISALRAERSLHLAEKAKLPRAPFVGDAESWTALGLKKIIQHAVASGHDRVTFINGRQSAKRWGERVFVSHLTYDGKTLRGYRANDVVYEKEAKPENLAAIASPEVAKDLLAQEPIDGVHALSRKTYIGGEGLMRHYNQTIPRVLNKVLNNLLKGSGTKIELERIRYPDISDPFIEDGDTQLSFKITPELRAAVEKGIPLFSQREATGERHSLDTLKQEVNRLYGKDVPEIEISTREKEGVDEKTQGFFDPKTNRAVLIADNISKGEDIHGLLRHEVAVHLKKLGATDEEFQGFLRQLEALRDRGAKDIVDAFNRVPKGTQADRVTEEALAYLSQHKPNLPIVKRFMSWLRRNAYKISGSEKWLRGDDFAVMADVMLREMGIKRQVTTPAKKPLTKFERKSFLTGAREAISHIVMAAVDPNVLGKDYAKLRRQLVAESAGLAKALETQATYDPDVGIRVDYIRNQYDSAFQIVQEGLYTGVPMLEGKTGLTRIEPTSRLNLDRLMKDASELPLSISYDGTTKEPLAVMADIFRIKMGELEFQERDEAARKLQTLRNLPKATRERKDVKAEIEKLRELAKGDRERSVTQNDIDWANAEIRRVDGVQDILDRWAEINQHLLAFERDSGWLSKDAYDKLSERSAYIPLFMPMEDVLARRGEAPVYPGGGPTTIGRLMPKTGRGSLLSTNVYENMAKRYAAAISNGMMNNVKVRAYEQLYRLGLAERMPINTKAKENIVKMRKDGQEFVYRVTDSEAYNSLTMAGMWNHPLLDLAALPANLVRRTALFGNPEYYFRTIVYEPLAANLVSTARGAIGPVTPIDALYEMAKIALHISKSAPELQRYGVSGTTHMERAYERFAKGLSDAPRSQRLWKYMEKAHAAFDEATRNIIYKAAQKEAAKQGIDDPQVIKDIAAVKARDFADFGTRGSMQLMRAASKQVPFLHSHLVGMDKMIRSATGHGQNTEEGRRQKQRFISNALIGASTVVGLTLVNSQDKRYRDLPIKEWARNLIVGFDEDGRAIKIPIPQELGFLVKYLPEQLTRSLIGVSDAPETKKALHNMAMDTLMPPGMSDPTLVAFRGWLQLHTNTELYSGLPIESPQELLELPIDRNKRATIFAKELAKVAEEQGWDDYSPEKFDSFMRTYFTNLYSTTALAAEMYWDYRTGKRGLFELPFNKDVTERYPWVKVALSNPKNISAVPRFYEMAKPLYETLKSVNLLSHAGVDSDEHARYERLIADPVVMTRYRGAKIAEMYRKQIHNIENAIDQLGARKDLTEAERRRKYMDGIKSRNELARVAVERLSDMLLQDRKLWKDIANSTYQHMEMTRDELTKEIGDFGANIGEPSESPE